jgi:hypothetical protein
MDYPSFHTSFCYRARPEYVLQGMAGVHNTLRLFLQKWNAQIAGLFRNTPVANLSPEERGLSGESLYVKPSAILGDLFYNEKEARPYTIKEKVKSVRGRYDELVELWKTISSEIVSTYNRLIHKYVSLIDVNPLLIPNSLIKYSATYNLLYCVPFSQSNIGQPQTFIELEDTPLIIDDGKLFQVDDTEQQLSHARLNSIQVEHVEMITSNVNLPNVLPNGGFLIANALGGDIDIMLEAITSFRKVSIIKMGVNTVSLIPFTGVLLNGDVNHIEMQSDRLELIGQEVGAVYYFDVISGS